MLVLRSIIILVLIFIFVHYFGSVNFKKYFDEPTIFIEREGPVYNDSYLPMITVWSKSSVKEVEKIDSCRNATNITDEEMINCLQNGSILDWNLTNIHIYKFDNHSEKIFKNLSMVKTTFGSKLEGLKLNFEHSFDLDFTIFQFDVSAPIQLTFHDHKFFIEDTFRLSEFGIKKLQLFKGLEFSSLTFLFVKRNILELKTFIFNVKKNIHLNKSTKPCNEDYDYNFYSCIEVVFKNCNMPSKNLTFRIFML